MRLKRGTTELPDGNRMIYDGDLTILDKNGDVISWLSSDLLELLWGENQPDEESKEGGRENEE